MESWWLIGPDKEAGAESGCQETVLNLAMGD